MDSQKTDESRNRSREEALARRMGEALDRMAPGDAGECPDAGLIAAYHEKALQADEIAQWENHFAICSRCRKILAVLAASVDAPLAEEEVAHLGELVAAAQTAKPVRPHRLAWRMRWLAPALGVAAALAVWFALRPPWRTLNQNPSGVLIAQAPKAEPPPNAATPALEQFSKVEPKKKTDTDAASLKDRAVTTAQSPNPSADARAKNPPADNNAIGKITASTGVAESAARNERREQIESNSAAAGASATAPQPGLPAARPPQALPQAQDRVTRQAPSVTETPGSAAQSVVVTAEAPAVSTTAGTVGGLAGNAPAGTELPLNGRTFRELPKLDATGEIAVQAKTPSGTVWRIGRGGSIQRSSDAGRTWILQASPSQEEWLAGAAVSDTVCWIVGRNGAIARTTDGERWEKIAPPSLAAAASGKFPDWISVTARDAQAATITASDQRRYATQDGGRTWRTQ